MCGIIGYFGGSQAAPIILSGLRRLEYRGYDSAGVAIPSHGKLQLHKTRGTMDVLVSSMPEMKGTMGIGHTRWATHGAPSTVNAHPHIDASGTIAVVHNGIIENFREKREEMEAEGVKFISETDTEIIPHLIAKHYSGSLVEAVTKTVAELSGSYAIAVVHTKEDVIVGARKDSPLILAIGDGELFLASDMPAVLEHTNKVIYLENGDIISIGAEGYNIRDESGQEIKREVHTVDLSMEDAEKGGYPHFMLKEIFEQPNAVHKSLLSLPVGGATDPIYHSRFDSIKIIACGTSYHASLVGKYIIEELASIPVSVEMASEYRYSPNPSGNPLLILVTQSGETADTVAAAREGRLRGRRTLAVTNVVGSSVTREVDHVIYTRAGLEIGVAATKTFTAQVLSFYAIGLNVGMARHQINADHVRDVRQHLRILPRLVQKVLDNAPLIEKKSQIFSKSHSAFFIGRNINYPMALEGALKMKEISYIHAEGYPAGELKHGPLALITEDTPVVAVAIRDHTYEKMLGNIGEVAARSGPVLAIGDEENPDLIKYSDDVIKIPFTPPLYSPILVGVVLQLLAYYAARNRGCEIDKPRNLAKSVTVE